MKDIKINGLLISPKWKKSIPHDNKSIECIHCKYQKAEDSIPRKEFKINIPIINKLGKEIGVSVKTVKEVTIVRGSHDDIIGWKF
jgi:hypothetical protein